MLIAHLPAGYLLGSKLRQDIAFAMPVVLFGSILPDLDMFFFYFVDEQSVHHHRYWVHIPFFWLCVFGVLIPIAARTGHLAVCLAFGSAILLHLFLDTIGGGILWFAPFSDELISFTDVPATRGHWILSFMSHWTFALEIAICVSAGCVLWLEYRKNQI